MANQGLGEVTPSRNVLKSSWSYSECVEVVSSRLLELIKQRPDHNQARHAVEGTLMGGEFGPMEL